MLSKLRYFFTTRIFLTPGKFQAKRAAISLSDVNVFGAKQQRFATEYFTTGEVLRTESNDASSLTRYVFAPPMLNKNLVFPTTTTMISNPG